MKARFFFKMSGTLSTDQCRRFYVSLPFSVFVIGGVSLPFLGLICCAIFSVILSFDEVTESVCGVSNFIPSISAATGVTPQLYFWRYAIGLHSAPRILLAVTYYQYHKEAALLLKRPFLFNILIKPVLVLNLVDVTTFVGVAFVSNRENYPVHEGMFVIFLFASSLYMMAILLMHVILKSESLLCHRMQHSFAIKRAFLLLTLFFISILCYHMYFHRLHCLPNASRMKQHGHEKKAAIETCIRSFIIKAIHSIVQARNGIVYNTNCISAVGARNNLMVNIEEDPEIGATIKHTLHAGFPVRVRDLLSLEILTAWPNHARNIVEVWQFGLDTSNRLDQPDTDNPDLGGGGGGKPSTDQFATTTEEAPTEIAVEDFRQSRLFEKLCTLLKSIIVATRLLPAYRFSREQSPEKYQMCYVLRRGLTNFSRLHSSVKCQQIGRLFSGLAINAVPNQPDLTNTTSDGLNRVFLNCRVHYCSELPVRPPPPPIRPRHVHPAPLKPKWAVRADEILAQNEETLHSRGVALSDARHPMGYPRVFPAFVQHDVELPEEEVEDDLDPMFLDPANDYYARMWSNEDDYDEQEEDYGKHLEDANSSDLDETEFTEAIHAAHQSGVDCSPDQDDDVHSSEMTDNQAVDSPLQLPFSTAGVSADRLTQLFTQLRDRADLDLFHIQNPNAQSSLFDADALASELDQHETTLKEFDDFLSEFCHKDPYLGEVRPMAGNLKVPTRSNAPFGAVEPS